MALSSVKNMQLRGKNATHRRRAKWAAALRAAATLGGGGVAFFRAILGSFRRNFQPNRAKICPSITSRTAVLTDCLKNIPPKKNRHDVPKDKIHSFFCDNSICRGR